MTELAAATDVQGMFNRIAGRYDAANRVMSGGMDILWRKKAIKRLLEGLGETPRLLDLGAGTLDGALEIARRCRGARVVGADIAAEMLKVGRAKLRELDRRAAEITQEPVAQPLHLTARVETQVADGHHLPYATHVFDGAFSAFCVRNLADLPRGMAELRRVVRPGGRIVILEFFRPQRPRPFFDGFYNAHVLPLIGWTVTGDRDAYRYLPQSIARFVSRAEYETLLRQVGFARVESTPLFPADIASMVVAS